MQKVCCMSVHGDWQDCPSHCLQLLSGHLYRQRLQHQQHHLLHFLHQAKLQSTIHQQNQVKAEGKVQSSLKECNSLSNMRITIVEKFNNSNKFFRRNQEKFFMNKFKKMIIFKWSFTKAISDQSLVTILHWYLVLNDQSLRLLVINH